MRPFFIAVIIGLLGTKTYSQNKISGKVVDDSSGDELIGAHVSLLNNWRVGAVTDISGNYSLKIPDQSKNDSLLISYIGYSEIVMALKNDLTIRDLTIRLTLKDQVINEVVISAKPLISEEFKYVKIDKLSIYTNPAAKADPILAVNSLLFATTTDESANISLRGSSPIETGIFLNNIPIYDAVRYAQLDGIGTFSIFNTSIIKDVTIFPGNPPLEFGGATSGIISLTTDDRILDDNTNSAIISLASIGFSREQKINSNQSIKIFTNYQPFGAIKALNSESLSSIKSFKSGDLGIYWYGKSNNWKWKILNYSLLEGYKVKFRHPSFNGIFDQKKRRSFLASSFERNLGKGTLSVNVGGSTSSGIFQFSSSNFEVANLDGFYGMNYLISKPKYSLKTGLSLDHRKSNVNGTFHEFSYALGNDHPVVIFREKTKTRSLESFTYFKYYFSEKLVLGTGLRSNIPISDQEHLLGQQMNLSYSSGPWTVIAGAGQYFKKGMFENSGERVTITSSQYSLDIRYDYDSWQSSLSLFNKNSVQNNIESNVKGAELFLSKTLSSKLKSSASITWLNAEREDGLHPYDLNYFIKGNLTYSPASSWIIETNWVARQGLTYLPLENAVYQPTLDVFEPSYAQETNRLPSYFNLSTSISKIINVSDEMNLIAFASMANLTDHQNVRNFTYSFDYSTSSPSEYSRRTGYVGVIFNF